MEFRVPIVVAAVLGLGVSPAMAGEVAVTFLQAADAASASPKVREGERAQRSLEAASQSAPRLDANPVVTIGLGPRLSPAPSRQLEGTVGLSQAVSLEGAARLRRKALAAEARTQAASTLVTRVALRMAASRAWLDLWAAQQQLTLARQEHEVVKRAQRAVDLLVGAHERTSADALVAQRQTEEAALRVLAAEGALVDAQAQLGSELGLGADDTPVASGEPADVLPPSDSEQRAALASVEQMPSVQVARLLAAEERLRGAEEHAGRSGWLTVGVEARRDVDGLGVLGTLTLPLPLQRVGLREQASRQAAATRAEGEAQDATRRGRRELVLAFHEVDHTDEIARSLDERVVPVAEKAVAALDRAFSAGEVTLLERIDGQRSLLDARSRRLAALRDRAWARVRASVLVDSIRRRQP